VSAVVDAATLEVPAPGAPPALEAVGLGKRFGSVLALDDVSLRLERGTVHALLGENGAGKSTLVKCIMGYYRADVGRVSVGGVEARIGSPRDAAALGIGMVYQHFTLVEAMSVAENLVLARQKHPFVFDWAAERAGVAAFMEKMPFKLDPAKPVRTLSAGEKQKLEILKQLYLGSTIMILDEPTSVLTPAEADEVLGLLRGMVHEGRLTVLMISHKFREVMQFADEVTVLRRGRLAGRGRVADLDPDAMARMMVGDEPPRATGTRDKREPGAVVLDIEGLAADDDLGMPAVSGLGLRVRAGEIVGIAGVSGNGQEELVEVLAGQRAPRAGKVAIGGAGYEARRAEMRTLMVRCLPDEPLRNACVGTMSVAENIGFRRFDRPPFRRAGVLVSGRALRRRARELIRDYGIRTSGPDAAIAGLSGGNVQRAVLARELSDDLSLLIASNPCFGLDFAAVAEIRTRIMDARNRGAAVLLISADLDEIFALADRVVVMSEGRAVHETPIETADLAVIGRHMAGHA
jgi:simple sugar transport system ATP-binding protein